jgi:hypothetical protein
MLTSSNTHAPIPIEGLSLDEYLHRYSADRLWRFSSKLYPIDRGFFIGALHVYRRTGVLALQFQQLPLAGKRPKRIRGSCRQTI